MDLVLDDKDKKIIEALRRNARSSTQEISKITQIPITTVHNRLKRLEESGAILQYTTIVDEKLLGNEVIALIMVQASGILPNMTRISQSDLAKRIKAIKEVTEVNSVIGSADLAVRAVCRSIDHLNDHILHAIKNMGGVEKVHTLIVLKRY